MLSGISSYLFGAGSEEDHPAATTASAINLALPHEKDLELRTTPAHDGEWMLVDRLSRSASPSESSKSSERAHLPSAGTCTSGLPLSSSTAASKAGSSRKAGLHMTLRQPHQPRVTAQRSGILSNSVRSKPKKQKAHHLTKNSLRRSNKSNHYESGCKIKRRKDHMLHPSGRSNDRKCQ